MAVTRVKRKKLGYTILVQFVEQRDKNNILCCFLINSTNRSFSYLIFIILVSVCKPCFLRKITRPYSFLLLLSLHLSTMCQGWSSLSPLLLGQLCCLTSAASLLTSALVPSLGSKGFIHCLEDGYLQWCDKCPGRDCPFASTLKGIWRADCHSCKFLPCIWIRQN